MSAIGSPFKLNYLSTIKILWGGLRLSAPNMLFKLGKACNLVSAGIRIMILPVRASPLASYLLSRAGTIALA
ncbi:MAG: hypothetical protein EAZ86_28500 [Oscillatoriales cyanobacterium]|nr:MAG: hypothetical protein EAZ86_28500 [Oscillatoriales cyanobacterium]